MAISLKTRRLRARGFNARQASLLGSRTFRGIGNRATLTTALAGAENDITLIARTPGTAGNAITFRIVVAGNDTPLSVGVTGSAITVNAATGAAGAVTSTAKDVVNALLASEPAKLLVWAQVNAPANSGTGVVAALAATNLAGASQVDILIAVVTAAFVVAAGWISYKGLRD